MKYFSETLNKVFDTADACNQAEEAYALELKKKEEAKLAQQKKNEELKAQRETRAKEEEAAFQKVEEDRAKATELLQAFCADYGSFHTTLKTADLLKNPFTDWFNHFELF